MYIHMHVLEVRVCAKGTHPNRSDDAWHWSHSFYTHSFALSPNIIPPLPHPTPKNNIMSDTKNDAGVSEEYGEAVKNVNQPAGGGLLGTALQGTQKAANQVAKGAKDFNEKHKVTEKTKEIADKITTNAKTFDQEHKVTENVGKGIAAAGTFIGGAIAKATGKPAPQPPSSKDNEGLE